MNKENLEKILNGLDLIREAVISEFKNNINVDDLHSNTLKELKELAKILSISTRGTKSDIIERILEAQDTIEESTEEEFVVEGSDVRIEAVKNKFVELMIAIKDGEIELSEVKEFFPYYYEYNKSKLKKIQDMNDKDLVKKYCWIQANLFDDEGDKVDFCDPYMVGDVPYCCGMPMKHIDGKTYLCEIDEMELEIVEDDDNIFAM